MELMDIEIDNQPNPFLIDDVKFSDDEDHQVNVKIPDYWAEFEEELDLKKKEALVKKPLSRVDELMKKSVIGDDFESLKVVPSNDRSRHSLRRQRKKEREMTKGPDWFNLPVQEMTEEMKNNIDLLKMRSILDPKHKYKNNDINHTPKYFQIGTVVDNAADYYNGRIPKSQRKRTLVEELLADAETQAIQKKKYKSIVNPYNHKKKGKKNNK